MNTEDWYQNCTLCPRNCKADRGKGEGFCQAGNQIRAARAALHYYEEPFLSGKSGSGAVFFSGCSLRCIYCQNGSISGGGPEHSGSESSLQESFGIEISAGRLTEIFFELKEKGALNINLVTGSHYTPDIAKALRMAKQQGFDLPVIWNSSGYELPKTLEELGGLVDIFLPDFKTLDPELAKRYMHAPDYPEIAKAALAKMVEITGPFEMELSDAALSESEEGLLKKGVCVRHLLTPGNSRDSKAVIDYLYDTYGDTIWVSLMSQYTPMGHVACEELNRKVGEKEYEEVVDAAIEKGLTYCMIQEGDTAEESFIPDFNGEGILPKK